MKLLLIGTIVGLLGVVLIKTEYDLIGILLIIGGLSLALKGRNELDKTLPPKP